MRKFFLVLFVLASFCLFADVEVEPNDTWDASGVITVVNGQHSGTVDPGEDLDYFAFEASTGDVVVVSTVGLTELDTKLWLYDVDGVTELAYNDDSTGLQSMVTITVEMSGTYYFVVGSYGTNVGDYGVDLSGATIPQYLDNDLYAMALTGNPTPTVGTEEEYVVTLKNIGNNVAAAFSAELFDGNDVSLGTVDGTDLAAGEITTLNIAWTPATEGEMTLYSVVTLASDEDTTNNTTSSIVVDVQASGTVVVTIGDGTEMSSVLPLNYYWKNSLTEQLYYASEFQIGGALMSIDFFYNFTIIPTTSDFKIWIGETDLTDLSGGFIPSTDLTLVYDGTYDFVEGEGTLHIALDTPYAYGGGNLVVLAQRPLDTEYYTSSDKFYYTVDDVNVARTVEKHSDTDEFDPTVAYTDGNISPNYANAAFYFVTEGMGAITGTVTSDGAPVADAMVSIDGTASSTMTNAAGEYTFGYAMQGTVSLTASKHGFIDGTIGDVVVVENETTTADITMAPLPAVMVSGYVYGSDYPTVGIADAAVTLTGYENYDAVTDANGMYSFAAVYANNDYEIGVSAEGYSSDAATITVADVDLVVDDITLLEVVSPASNVVATPNAELTEVAVTWEEPTGVLSGFEFDGTTLPDGFVFGDDTWSMEGDGYLTSTGTSADDFHACYNDVVVEDGVFEFVWQRTSGSESSSQGCVVRSNGDMSTGDGYIFVFSANGSYICGTITGGSFAPWVSAWTPSANLVTGLGMDNTITISMQGSEFSMYINGALELTYTDTTYPSGYNTIGYHENDGSVVKFDRYEFIDGGTVDRNNEVVAIQAAKTNKTIDLTNSDVTAKVNNNVVKTNVKVVNESRNSRMVETYDVYRLLTSDHDNPDAWVLLAEDLTDMSYTDAAFGSVSAGIYKYAVVAMFTNDVPAPAAFSNEIASGVSGTVTFVVTTNDGNAAEGASIAFEATDGDPDHVYEATTDAAGNAIINDVWFTTYDLDVTLSGHNPYADTGIVFDDDATISVVLNELTLPPAGLEVTDFDDNSATIAWTGTGAGGSDYFEDFEGTFPPTGWTKLSPDAGTGWDQIAVGTTPLPGWTGGDAIAAPNGGDYMAYATYTTGGASSNDQWLISPQIEVGSASVLSFNMVCWYASSYPDHVEILISTTNNSDVSAFDTEVAIIELDAVEDEEWVVYNYNLSDFVTPGEEVYIGIREVVADNLGEGAFVAIDNFSIGAAVAMPAGFVNSRPALGAKDDAYEAFSLASTYNLETREVTGYNVYLDGTEVASGITETVYAFTGLNLGTVYEAGVTAVYTGDIESEMVTVEITTTEDGGNLAPALATKLGVNYPNPFNPVTNIRFSLKNSEDVSVQVYNVKGELVNTLLNERLDAGDHNVVWEGYDNNQRPCASGVYFYKMKAGRYTSTKKMILMK